MPQAENLFCCCFSFTSLTIEIKVITVNISNGIINELNWMRNLKIDPPMHPIPRTTASFVGSVNRRPCKR